MNHSPEAKPLPLAETLIEGAQETILDYTGGVVAGSSPEMLPIPKAVAFMRGFLGDQLPADAATANQLQLEFFTVGTIEYYYATSRKASKPEKRAETHGKLLLHVQGKTDAEVAHEYGITGPGIAALRSKVRQKIITSEDYQQHLLKVWQDAKDYQVPSLASLGALITATQKMRQRPVVDKPAAGGKTFLEALMEQEDDQPDPRLERIIVMVRPLWHQADTDGLRAYLYNEDKPEIELFQAHARALLSKNKESKRAKLSPAELAVMASVAGMGNSEALTINQLTAQVASGPFSKEYNNSQGTESLIDQAIGKLITQATAAYREGWYPTEVSVLAEELGIALDPSQ